MENYKKYRWFYTSSGKLVIGGKNSSQNDSLLKETKKDYIIMHTSTPGSPFTIIISDIKSVKKSDLNEAAIFTACFSQAWKSGKKEADIHIFTRSQLEKKSRMKEGTWGVLGKVQKTKVKMELTLTIQQNTLRAVPLSTIDTKPTIILSPGKLEKEHLVEQIQEVFKASKDEILSALPAGGIKINIK